MEDDTRTAGPRTGKPAAIPAQGGGNGDDTAVDADDWHWGQSRPTQYFSLTDHDTMVTAQEPLKHDGKEYEPGDEVDMTPEEAEENGLVAIGAVEVTEEVEATDAARELAEEEDVDLSDVEGTGSDGKVLKSDVQDALDE